MLTTRQVADLLAIHPSTVRSYVRDGKIKAHHLGRYVRISIADFEQFVKDRNDGN